MYILGNFLYIAVLLINAIAVLSEDRFLARSTAFLIPPSVYSHWINLSPSSYDPAFGQSTDASVKAKIINLIASVRTLMRIPLIAINTLIIFYELILG
ncbi:Protein transport protein YOS1 [Colletotrichum tropicale]|nr:Protein transport protein YOS1 [Colletotrichum tropicale]